VIVSVLLLTVTLFFVPDAKSQNLGPSVNTEGDEYVNQIIHDSIIFTRRSGNEFIFVTELVDRNYLPAKSLDINWNNVNSVGAANFTPDMRRLYFVGIGYRDGFGRGDIYYSDYIDNQWSTPVNIGKPINSATMESQPCISADGNELYFVRDTKQYKSNIYLSEKNYGRWSAPKPLNSLNTKYNEMSPFVSAKDNILYFASDVDGGLGGYDIYMCRRLPNGDWGKPENLGKPINSEKNEISFRVSADGRKCYVSSDRDGGFGGFDIYVFDYEEPDVSEYLPHTPFVMRNIQFEFDSAILHESSFASIDSLANYLKDNPLITIEISGHTDNSGTKEHNLQLSEARANSVKAALIERGILSERMSVVGYGAQKPLVPNDSEENKVLNRRVEVSLLVLLPLY